MDLSGWFTKCAAPRNTAETTSCSEVTPPSQRVGHSNDARAPLGNDLRLTCECTLEVRSLVRPDVADSWCPDLHMPSAVHSIPDRVSKARSRAAVSGLGCTVWAFASLSVHGVVSAQNTTSPKQKEDRERPRPCRYRDPRRLRRHHPRCQPCRHPLRSCLRWLRLLRPCRGLHGGSRLGTSGPRP